MQTGRFVWILVLGLGLTLALLIGLRMARAAPTGANLFVKPTGSGSACTQAAPCALQIALSQAVNGDAIYVAGGNYTGGGAAIVTITEGIALYGGWNGLTGTVVRDPAAYPTTLDGEGQRRVIYIGGSISPTIEGFIITRGRDYTGGGIYVERAAPIIASNVITNNVALYYGGGVYVDSGTPVITANTVLSNSAAYGGGGLFLAEPARVTLHDNRIAQNQANYGGGFDADRAIVTATGNVIVHNQASSALVLSGPGSRLLAANNVLANNSGTAFNFMHTHADLVHNTIVGNKGHAVSASYTATITLTNNIIANHATSSIITWTSGAIASASNNLFWDNRADPITGTNAVLDDPRFVNPMAGDYHIGPGSAAIAAGVNAGVTIDMDGDSRPAPTGTHPDLGADEIAQRYAYLPLVLRDP
jgi:hypothetical protein